MRRKNFKRRFEIAIGCSRFKDVRKFLRMGKEAYRWA
jgi:hypothetical protein